MGTFLFGLLGCFIMALPFLLLIWIIWAIRRRKNRPSKAVMRYRKEANDIERAAQKERDAAAAHCVDDIQYLARRRN